MGFLFSKWLVKNTQAERNKPNLNLLYISLEYS
jgi:hypothetical protein